jgi:hypothetical protein
MITPPLSISAMPRLTRLVPVALVAVTPVPVALWPVSPVAGLVVALTSDTLLRLLAHWDSDLSLRGRFGQLERQSTDLGLRRGPAHDSTPRTDPIAAGRRPGHAVEVLAELAGQPHTDRMTLMGNTAVAQSYAEDVTTQTDLWHQPAVGLIAAGIAVAALFVTIVSLRNSRIWLLQLTGRRAAGVVRAMEIVTSPNGEVLRRPQVAYTVATGDTVIASPLIFRTASKLDKGSEVQVRYAKTKPARMVVPGFGFRRRELIYAVGGIAVAIAITVWYVNL